MCFIWEDLDYFENKNYLETLSNKTFGDFYLKLFFLNWANPGLFLFFSSFQYNWQKLQIKFANGLI